MESSAVLLVKRPDAYMPCSAARDALLLTVGTYTFNGTTIQHIDISSVTC